jgi:aspartyl-tRNA(Asn)/glutamyl-tRNA(Gln) amidotransferase subunit B
MEEGSLRCDANVSVRPVGQSTFGTKTEVKNVNSFRFLQKALEFEIERQVEVLAAGGQVIQETRLWDSDLGETTSMRSKEDAHDYRYFPEPDLQPLDISAAWVEAIRAALPELPEARKARLMASYGLTDYDADLLVRLIAGGADYFERTVAAGASPKAVSNWIQGEIRRRLKDVGTDDIRAVPVEPERLAELIAVAERGVISSSSAKDVFDRMWSTGRPAQAIIDEEGLAQSGDEDAIAALVGEVLADNADVVAEFHKGRTNVLGFLVGQVMKKGKGRVNPKVANELVRRALGAGKPAS